MNASVGHFKLFLSRLILIGLLWISFSLVSSAQSFQDMFTNRDTVLTAFGSLQGNNTTATVEPGEPLHAGKPGGHSLWISWVAPTNGVVSFSAEGSDFDTLLAAYYFTSPTNTTFDKLQVAAYNDDFFGLEDDSSIQFGAQAGQHYEIAVDGWYGAVGTIELQWNFIATTSAPPIVVSVPADLSALQGATVSLSVNMQTSSVARLQWRLNENVELAEGTTNLVIPSLQPTNVGRYTLSVSLGTTNGLVSYDLTPIEVQINSDGATNTLARSKFLDAPHSALVGEDGNGQLAMRTALFHGPLLGVVRGYSGSQIFNTTYAIPDTNAPLHCGLVGGSPYWLAYDPPTNGTISLDTIGSSYDTIIQAYTYNGTPTNYADLISMACAHDNVLTQAAARISFPVFKTRQYLIVVDGTNGAFGTAWLNYRLDTNNLPTGPSLVSPPSSLTVATGTPVTLSLNLSGSAPLQFSWKKDQSPLLLSNSPALFIPSVSTTDSANYVVTVTNDLGALTSTLPLRVVIPPNFTAILSTGMTFSWQTISGQLYTIEQAQAVTGPWQPWTNSYFGDGSFTNVTADVATTGSGFFRIRVQ